MRIKLKWHKFLCWTFDHRWFLAVEKRTAWVACRRCAEARELPSGSRLPAHPAFRRWLYACAIVFLLIGYFLGTVPKSPDLPRVELAQAEIRRDLNKLWKLEDLEKIIDRYFQKRERIITRNQQAFVRPAALNTGEK